MGINISKVQNMAKISADEKIITDIKKMNRFVEKIDSSDCPIIVPRTIINVEDLREDKLDLSFSCEQTFQNSSKVRNNHFVVPIVVE